MPRIVNISSSDVSSDEEINTNRRRVPLRNQRPAHGGCVPRVGNTGYTNYSYNNIPMVSYSEDEVYCLARIIDGKVRKFKKDTRTWLHKSSEKKNVKHIVGNIEQASLLNRNRLPPNYSSFLSRSSNDKEPVVRGGDDKTILHMSERESDKNIMGMVALFNDDRGEGNKNYKETKPALDPLSEDEFTFIGDSDADLTYSEEDTPAKTDSYAEEWRQVGHSVSSDSSGIVDIIGKPEKCHSLSSIGSLRGESSFEELELGNESGNSIKTSKTELNIARKIAPAIEIDDESYRENILDYAVNQGSRPSPDGGRTCCADLFRKSRQRGSGRAAEEPQGPGSRRKPLGKHAASEPSRTTSRYNLRSTVSLRQIHEENEDAPNTSAFKTRNPPKKRLRFYCRDDAEPQCKQREPDHPLPERQAEPEAEVTDYNQPTCSKVPARRSKVPSLFVIAGYVLYGVFKSKVETF